MPGWRGRQVFAQSTDLLHGGAVMALADSTGGACAFLNLPEHAQGTTTVESKTNFLRGVREGYIEAVSRPLHVGRTVVVVETDVRDSERPPGRPGHSDPARLDLTLFSAAAAPATLGRAGPARPFRGPTP